MIETVATVGVDAESPNTMSEEAATVTPSPTPVQLA